MKKLHCIMLIDDSKDDNFFHERVIRKNNCAEKIVSKESGKAALEYLRNKTFEPDSPPELIFLDINMPGMSGWEFLVEYDKLDEDFKSKVIVTMLTTSDNPDDVAKARTLSPTPLKDFKTKPLTREILEEILGKYF